MIHPRPSTRLVCISDTHSHYSFDLLDGDILLHPGGISRTDSSIRNDFGIIYLQDEIYVGPVTELKLCESPWQPEFCDWAFNVERE
ncbi:unnamed protein product [Adineta ricciae]|uniref:Uncharacterized protein n=1 Tax=Adineta ricciae TaxID=249248 RepID=A0A814RZU0_ADIRI|nr:unnamed protein product [Adineta ricciae]CAF1140150.1 unnamed protein product [Adineta ricciae]